MPAGRTMAFMLVREHPTRARFPSAAFIALSAAGRKQAAIALARNAGTMPSSGPRTRDRLARLCLAAGDRAAMAEIVVVSTNATPGLDALRAEVELEAGAYREALRLARRARAGGVDEARRVEERVTGHLVALAPGWLPDPGREGEARLNSVRGAAVRGRVLHVVSTALPHRLVGYTVRTHSVVRCQRDVGLVPEVVSRKGFAADSDPTVIDEVDGIRYHRVSPGFAAMNTDRQLIEFAKAVVPIVAEFRPAVIHAASNHLHAQVALALGRRVGVPVVYEARGFWEESWLSSRVNEDASLTTDRYEMTRAAETSAILAADAVVTLSDVMKAEIVERGRRPEDITVVPNAVDAEAFAPMPRDERLATALGIGTRDQVVGYISTFSPYEGIPYLVEAVGRLRQSHPDVKLLLVGDGVELSSIREAIAHHGLQQGAILTGRVPHDTVRNYYSLIDIFVVPRTGHRVSRLVTPLKPYEALSMERAVLVSDLPALREVVIPGETGLTFRPEDPLDLADRIRELLDDPGLRQQLGRQGREWVLSERTWAANGHRYRALYERLGAA